MVYIYNLTLKHFMQLNGYSILFFPSKILILIPDVTFSDSKPFDTESFCFFTVLWTLLLFSSTNDWKLV